MPDNATPHRQKHLNLRASLLVFLFALISPLLFSPNAFALGPVTTQTSTEPKLSYEALAEVLADDQVRDKLINELRTLAHEDGTVEKDAAVVTQSTNLKNQPSISEPNRFVARLQIFAQNLRNDVMKSWEVVRPLGRGDIQHLQKVRFWQTALFNLLITIITVILAYLMSRRIAHPVFTRIDQWAQRQPSKAQLDAVQNAQKKRHFERKKLAEESKALQEKEQAEQLSDNVSSEFAHIKTEEDTVENSPHIPQASETHQVLSQFKIRFQQIRKLAAVVFAFVIDVLTFVAAALVGYVVVLALPTAQSAQNATLLSMQFLTAFFAIEMVKTLSRAIFSTRYDHLRLVPISSKDANYWNRWVATIITIGGYGLLVFVPVLENVLSAALASVVGAVLILAVYIYAIRVLWSKRKSVTATILHLAENTENSQNTFMGSVLRITAKLWIWVALLYFTVLFVVTQADQQNALGFMANASAQTLLALIVGGVLSLLLSSLVTYRLHLSAHWNQSFPLLEERLNSYIPTLFRVLRIVVFAGVLLSIFDAWQLLSLKSWFGSEQGQAMFSTIIRVALVLIISALSWTVLASIIEHRLASSGSKMPTEREKTLLMLFRNALAIVIVTLTALIVLSQLGIDIGPLIAGAGVIGLAVGFGAQKLVQDVITGVFIQLENGMNQNDVVEVAGLFGVVEKLTIRSVVIRTLDGGYHLVPFSSIDCVANHTRDYGYHVGEYLISLDQSVDEAIVHLEAAFEDLKKDEEVADAILEDMTIPGVSALGREGAKIRILIKTTPGMQWAVQRSFNRLVKQHFDAAGIEIPYPQTVLHFGRDKNGTAAPANIDMVDAVAQSTRGGKTITPETPGKRNKEVFQDDISDLER